MSHYVYILRCADGSLYVGSAHDVDARLKAHNEGRGAAYTFKHHPAHVVYSESFSSQSDALTRERQLKHWSRGKKEALINGDLDRLKQLSKRRSPRGRSSPSL
jgi:putative endonuclease